MERFAFSTLSLAIAGCLGLGFTPAHAAITASEIWDGEDVPAHEIIRTKTSADLQGNSWAGLYTQPNAQGVLSNLNVQLNAQNPENESGSEQLIAIYVAGGDVELAGDRLSSSITTNFLGGGNNQATALFVGGGELTVSSKEVHLNVASTAEEGKSVYGISSTGNLNFTSETVDITLSTATDRKDVQDQYSQGVGIDLYGGQAIFSEKTNVVVRGTSTSPTLATNSAANGRNGAQLLWGLRLEGGQAVVKGSFSTDLKTVGGDASGVTLENHFYNSSMGHNYADSALEINNMTLKVHSELAEATGIQTLYTPKNPDEAFSVLLNSTGTTNIEVSTNSGQAKAISVKGPTTVNLLGNVTAKATAGETGTAHSIFINEGVLKLGGALNRLEGDALVAADGKLILSAGLTDLNGQLDASAGSLILDKAILVLHDDAKIDQLLFGLPLTTFALSQEEEQDSEVRIMGGRTEISGGTGNGQGSMTVAKEGSLSMGGTSTFKSLTAEGPVSLQAGASLSLTEDSSVTDFHAESAQVTLAEERKLKVGGEMNVGTFSGDKPTVVFTKKEASFHMGSNQTTGLGLEATGEVTDDLDGDINALIGKITVGGTTPEGGEPSAPELDHVTMQEGDVVGEVSKVGDGPIVEKTNASNDAKLNRLSAMPAMMTRIQMNELRKRMGDIRAAEGQTGVWARYNGGNLKGDYELDADFNMIQVGADTKLGNGLPRVGAAFSYARTEADDLYGSVDMDAYSLSGYGIWTWDNGAFADVIARVANVDTDMKEGVKAGSLDNWLFSLSSEIGQRAQFAGTFYVEPSAEMTYTWMEGGNFRMGDVDRKIGDTESLIGRFGVALGKACPSGYGDFYIRAGLVHEFMGNASITTTKNSTTRTIVQNGNDTWIEYAVGGNINFNKNTYLYADLERTEGAALEEDWRANLGVRYSF